ESYCPRTPPEYLEGAGIEALKPVTAESIAAAIASTGDRTELQAIAGSMAALEEGRILSPEQLTSLLERLRAAFARLIDAAVRSGDEYEAVASFYGVLGLRPPLVWKSGGELLRLAQCYPEGLASAMSEAPPADFPARHLDFGPGYVVGVDLESTGL